MVMEDCLVLFGSQRAVDIGTVTRSRGSHFLSPSNRGSRDEVSDQDYRDETLGYRSHDRWLLSRAKVPDHEARVECYGPRLGYLELSALQISPSDRVAQ